MHFTYVKLVVLAAACAILPSALARATSSGDKGTRWALLFAGSNSIYNYRHQADICHAYQLLKLGGLKDENIIVFMADDIASNPNNPHPGKIFNRPGGPDVYQGVPKDYTGDNVNVENFYAAILGNRSAISGGSGKVLETGPNDHIFIYYSDHGDAGVLNTPNGELIMANDLIGVLKKKHTLNSYKSLLFYVEACESGSIFQALLPDDLNIYALTAANSTESSYATYCPQDGDYYCLGDLFSVAWMEDTENHNRGKETLLTQYEHVKARTINLE